MASTYLTYTPSGSTNQNKWTFSAWVKRSSFGEQIITSVLEDSTFNTELKFDGDNTLVFKDTRSGNANGEIVTTAQYRDIGGWYHIVVVFDKDNSTSADKTQMYVNGERVAGSNLGTYTAAYSGSTYGTTSHPILVGFRTGGSAYFDGLMSHIHYCVGYAYDASYFGFTDATTGEWQINTSPSVTYGSQGFFILKDGNSVTDQSGNSNNFTVGGGTLTNTEDSPSNNWVTFNPLCNSGSGQVSYSRANTRGGTGGGASFLSMMPTRGKWFMEFNMNAAGAGQDNGIGFWSVDEAQRIAFYASGFKGIVWKYAGNVYVNGSNNAFSSSTFTSGDIISVAMDMDNSTATFYKNGSVATNLNAYSFPFTERQAITVGIIDGASSGAEDGIFDFNSGANPTFGGRKTAGGNADGNSQGNFSMAVPSGYYALNTKNLNAYG